MDDLAKLHNQDPILLETVINEHTQALTNVAYRLTQSLDAAQDIVQDTFLAFLSKVKNFKGQSKVYTYLHRIVLNKSIDYVRVQKKTSSIPISQLDLTDHSASPVQHILQDETSETLYLCLNRVPDEQRIPFILAEMENLSYKEIAKSLKLPLNTVRTRIFRAREKLIRLLKGTGVNL